ncbi:MAG: anthranilate synthase component I family protein [Bacteroidota bacterium]|nr:anthranilate synthase component I family protein [Bacteroidota bacterium]
MNKAISTTCTFTISDFEKVKQKVLNWSQRFSTFCFLDNHQYQLEPHSIECLLAAGIKRQLKANAGNALEQLQSFIDEKQSWLFGHLGYDLKNEIEDFSSHNPDHSGFPDLFFFEPEIIIRLSPAEICIEGEHPESILQEVLAIRIDPSEKAGNLAFPPQPVNIQNRFSQPEYIAVINKLQQHILRGDCYEINFCQEFFAEKAVINPIDIYRKLSTISPNPFSALYRIKDQWLICASPERFLKKEGQRILSQPIKGTSRRITENDTADQQSKEELRYSSKDRSENVMVVDLVRNDLAKICEEGTVKVDELYGIYSFPQVHQMISTISGVLKNDIAFTDIIRATFPMGSMTGAPKMKVIELIEEYERTKRGIFSGAVGYISPGGDVTAGQAGFDFNVVIRSIMYNAGTAYLSFQAGSGITFYSDPEKEWQECMMKAEAIKKALE